MEKISFEDFEKLDLRVGKILSVEEHPRADKLYVLRVDIGESSPRIIVAGLRPYYPKESLLNKKAVFIANLAPRALKGIESNGMILAASSSNHEKVIFLSPEKDIEPGSKIR